MFKLVVLSVALAVVAANPNGVWGAGLATPWGAPVVAGVAAPLASPVFTPLFRPVGPVAPIGEQNYRGPLSLAPGQPANILAADGRPLDTYSVNLDRVAHYTAKAVDNGRRLQKRSAVAANVAAAHLTAANAAAAHNLVAATLAAGSLAGPLASVPLAATPLAAIPLTAGRSWVGPAPYAISAAAPIAPLGLGVGANVGNIW